MPSTTTAQRYLLLFEESIVYRDERGRTRRHPGYHDQSAHERVTTILCRDPFGRLIDRYAPAKERAFVTFKHALDKSLLDLLRKSTAGIVAKIETAPEAKKHGR